MKNILVTGAKGQLGNKIIELMSDKYRLILTDTDNMDITDIDAVRETVEKEKPDYIIHGAAYTKVDAAEENIEVCRKINALGTKNIAEIAKEHGAILFYVSTDFVFDGSKNKPYSETDTTNPLSVYGITKLEGEEFVGEICTDYYILRVAWLFGELPKDHPGSNFVETMLRLAKERDSLNVVNDQIGSPTYTGDLVNVILDIIDKEIPFGTYHFSGTAECSWYEFAKEIFAQTSTKIDLQPIQSDHYPQKAKRPPYSYLSKSKIEEALSIEVRPWQEMLREYLNR